MKAVTSCGVVVTDGTRLLLGHVTRSPRWDIPKGVAAPGEDERSAALRELAEETGLAPDPAVLILLGTHDYLRGKALALFLWRPGTLPAPSGLVCASRVLLPDGTSIPEFDHFSLFAWDEALGRVGKNMARVLGAVRARCTA